jgi:uncharacterized membrane protein YccC
MDDDATDAAWHQAQQEERRQREEAAIARCRPLMEELRQTFEPTKGTNHGDHREIIWRIDL